MKLSGVECLQRGWSNLLANWELVLITCLQGFVVLLLVLGGIAVPFLAVGLSLAAAAESPEAQVAAFLERIQGATVPLLLGLVATLVLTTLGFLAFSYFQGGLFGVLYSADRQAPLGPAGGRNGHDRRLFRTFSGRDFAGWAARFIWRYFWFYNVAGLLFLGVGLLVLLWLGLTVYSTQGWGAPVAWSLGCGGALPVVFVLLVVSFAVSLAQADLPREDSGPMRSIRIGFEILSRRPGAVLLIAVSFVVASLAVSIAFLPVSLGITVGLADKPLQMLLARVVLGLIQMIPSAALNVFSAASFVALMRSELANARRFEVPPA